MGTLVSHFQIPKRASSTPWAQSSLPFPTHSFVSVALSLTFTSPSPRLPPSASYPSHSFWARIVLFVGTFGCCRLARLTAHSRHLHIHRQVGLTTAITTLRCNYRHHRRIPSTVTRSTYRHLCTPNPWNRLNRAHDTSQPPLGYWMRHKSQSPSCITYTSTDTCTTTWHAVHLPPPAPLAHIHW
jgi:hypothetical protein